MEEIGGKRRRGFEGKGERGKLRGGGGGGKEDWGGGVREKRRIRGVGREREGRGW